MSPEQMEMYVTVLNGIGVMIIVSFFVLTNMFTYTHSHNNARGWAVRIISICVTIFGIVAHVLEQDLSFFVMLAITVNGLIGVIAIITFRETDPIDERAEKTPTQ